MAAAFLAGCATVQPDDVTSQVEVSARERYVAAAEFGSGFESAAGVVGLAFNTNDQLRADLLNAGLAAADWQAASRPANPLVEFVTLPDAGHGRVYDIDLMASVMGVVATPWRNRAARARFEQAERLALLRAVDFAADVESAWIDAIAAKQRLDLSRRSLQSAEAAFVIAEEIRAAGNAPAIDLAREQAFLVHARIATHQAEAEAEAGRHALEVLVGAPVNLQALPARLPDLEAPAENVSIEALIESSLVLDAARAEVEASSRRAGLENWASLLEHAELGLVWEREDRTWTRGWTAEFSLPIFDQGQARRTQARLAAEQALARYDARLAEIRATHRNALAVAELSRTQWNTVEQSLMPSSEAVLDQSLLHYNAMQIGVFELLAAFEARIEAGQVWIDAQQSAHQADVQLRRLAAGGSPGAGSAMTVEGDSTRDAGGH